MFSSVLAALRANEMDLHLIDLPREVRNEHRCADDGRPDHIFHEFLVMDRGVNLFFFER